MDLATALKGKSNPRQIADLLNALRHEERVALVRKLSGKEQAALYASFKDNGSITLDDLVPSSLTAFHPVYFDGVNNIPFFSFFQKIMYRLPNRSIAGFNECGARWLVGPGYFTVTPDPPRGSVIINYKKLPHAHPSHFPDIQENDTGLSYFVYRGLLDSLYKVSEHVFVGAATRDGKPLPNYFVLVRDDSTIQAKRVLDHRISYTMIDSFIVLTFLIFFVLSSCLDSINATAPVGRFNQESALNRSWPLPFVVQIYLWWCREVDPMLLTNPVWVKCLCCLSSFVFAPFYLMAIHAILRRQNWIRNWIIMYAGMLFVVRNLFFVESMHGDSASPNFTLSFARFGFYQAFAVLLLWRFWGVRPFNRDERHPTAPKLKRH
eukprot:GILK01012470.1.p1 GENE.GILK01012470.1~~GILK01012470.1.p1  ORF type:complete len:378 (-),score=49.48 GILK01012470.1:213-1346(-)